MFRLPIALIILGLFSLLAKYKQDHEEEEGYHPPASVSTLGQDLLFVFGIIAIMSGVLIIGWTLFVYSEAPW